MQDIAGRITLSASDLANHLVCRHLTNLNLALAEGKIKAPRPTDTDDEIDELIEKGDRHERAYIEHLQAESPGIRVVELGHGATTADTERAMREGADVIAQAPLASGRWRGYADILRKVERPSGLGEWSYEVTDTKLARETKAGTVLQIALYTAIVGEIQGPAPDPEASATQENAAIAGEIQGATPDPEANPTRAIGATPEFMHVVAPGIEEGAPFLTETFRAQDYLAYYRLMRGKLEEAVGEGRGREAQAIPTYPEPVPHCDVCRWRLDCGGRRRRDDHLSLVAGLSTGQQREIQSWGVQTLAGFAKEPLPLARRPKRGSAAPYERAREQARVQLEGRERGAPYYELRPREPQRGLARLPEPSPGDVFFDIEGAPFVGTQGFEYLFGWATLGAGGQPEYHARWAFGADGERGSFAAGERAVFEEFIDYVEARRKAHPDLRIYHFAPYEPSALKRLMGRYATRQEEVDGMLRAELFVDLHTAARQAVFASVERYSIKDLEQFYGYARAVDLHAANDNRHALERLLETGRILELEANADTRGAVEKMRRVVEEYNRDDCVSTLRLRDWLEKLRRGLVESGEEAPRPFVEITPPKPLTDRQLQVQALKARLLDGVDDGAERSDEEEALWLTAHLLDWHRREAKSAWWEYFRLGDLGEDELRDEKAGLAGLTFIGRDGGTDKAPVHVYQFETQDSTVARGDDVHQLGGEGLGAVVEVDYLQRTVAVKKKMAAAEVHPPALYAANAPVGTDAHEESLLRIGEWIAANDVDAQFADYRAARDLLLARTPRLSPAPEAGAPLYVEGEESALDAAKRLARQLSGGVLPIQGPPGTGKTYTAARMICELVRNGKKVGITATSHSVIRNLLDATAKAAQEEGLPLRCLQKVGGLPENAEDSLIAETDSNASLLAALSGGQAQVGAGTSWVWAREEFAGSLDALFIDEAGQMSLANALAVAPAAANLILLGDPQQLEQPQQGSHPEGADASALQRLLGGRRTIPDDRGVFLGETFRMHPELCAFTSELFYDDRLTSKPDLANQAISGAGALDGAGLRLIRVAHEGNQSASVEEAERVADLHRQLLSGASWTDRLGASRPITQDDVLIVAPYNAHLAEIGKLLPHNARFGTVDKFQGQEAPIVIYSMATSSPEDAPRGMEFLYSLNRLNVATSRARCVSVLAASPLLFEPECKTPRQMRLANALCRYLEIAGKREEQ